MLSAEEKSSLWQKSDVNIISSLFSLQISERAEDVAANDWIYGFASTSHCAAADLSLLPCLHVRNRTEAARAAVRGGRRRCFRLYGWRKDWLARG